MIDFLLPSQLTALQMVPTFKGQKWSSLHFQGVFRIQKPPNPGSRLHPGKMNGWVPWEYGHPWKRKIIWASFSYMLVFGGVHFWWTWWDMLVLGEDLNPAMENPRENSHQAQLRPRGKFARAVGLEPVQREAWTVGGWALVMNAWMGMKN